MKRVAGLTAALAMLLLVGCGEDTASDTVQPPPPNEEEDVTPMPGFEEADPGRVTIHRLNRAEYNNTVRDLLDTALRPADDFPSDDHGYGFDNIADVLAISPLQIELYDRAAEMLVEEALRIPNTDPDVFGFEAEDVMSGVGGRYRDSGWNLWSNGALEVVLDIQTAGTYRFSALVFGQQAGPDPARMTFLLDGREIAIFDVLATQDAPETYEIEAEVTAGTRTFAVAFINDFYEPEGDGDRNLIVDYFQAEGPLGLTETVNETRDRILTCDPADTDEPTCGREIIGAFARRAWRRPVTDDEVDRLLAFLDIANEEGEGFETGISLAMHAILLSPHFLYRVELDADPSSDKAHRLNNHELASRLSYFLWSSTPDEALLQAADEGLLRTDEEITAQVERMLADPKSDALVQNFAGQWLHINALEDLQPDYNIFPWYDEELKDALGKETRLFFEEFLYGDMPLSDIFTVQFSYLNDRLAAHYDLEAPGTDDLVRVDLSGTDQRGGLLSHGSLLTVTSYPTRTSPVIRGKWILTQLLCSEPPAPPPGVEGLIEEEIPTGTLRERLEQHRQDPTCASCHELMDPLGFGLEKFDGTGRWRDEEFGFPVDDTGILDDGTEFQGVLELSDILEDDPRFIECATEKMFTYALGRGPGFHDRDDLEFIEEGFIDNSEQLSALVRYIALSHAFRYRRGEPEED